MKKYISWILVVIVACGVFFGLDYAMEKYGKPSQPHMILDPSVPTQNPNFENNIPYEPVEITGLNPSDGIIFVPCTIPAEYEQYVHYPDTWGKKSFFHPEGIFARYQWVVWSIIGLMVVGLIARIVYLAKKGRLNRFLHIIKKDGANNNEES